MKRQFSILLHLFIVLALSACGVTTPQPGSNNPALPACQTQMK